MPKIEGEYIPNVPIVGNKDSTCGKVHPAYIEMDGVLELNHIMLCTIALRKRYT